MKITKKALTNLFAVNRSKDLEAHNGLYDLAEEVDRVIGLPCVPPGGLDRVRASLEKIRGLL